MRVHSLLLFLLIFFCNILPLIAQRNGNDPYSSIGIGTPNEEAFFPNLLKGGTGVSTPSPRFTNRLNPALLTFNDLVTFDAGMDLQRHTLKGESTSAKNFGGNLSYLTITLPVAEDWTTSIGITPFSSVNYKFSTEELVTSPSGTQKIDQNLEGSGGITKVFLANGFNITNDFKLGLEANYLFGSTTHQFNSSINSSSRDEHTNQLGFSGASFKTGAFYQHELVSGQDLEEEVNLNAGATYSFNPSMKIEHLRVLRKFNTNGSQPRKVFEDTLSNQKVFRNFPSEFRGGISIQKPKNWSLALDFAFRGWSAYEGIRATDSLTNSYQIGLGGEYTPDHNSVDSYWDRVTYRAGVQFEQTPFVIEDQKIKELSLNFGATLPMGGRQNSLVTLGFSIGRRDLNRAYFTQDFIKAFVSFNVRDKWFTERRIK